ncbi:hypothetical protein G6F57_021461 [Rhizopus arrhizus]|nr:hypothetical protein G6F57_021461 [Rhizopus arrhizus]
MQPAPALRTCPCALHAAARVQGQQAAVRQRVGPTFARGRAQIGRQIDQRRDAVGHPAARRRSAGQCGRVEQHATPRGAHQRATQRAVLVLHDRFQPPHGLDKALL